MLFSTNIRKQTKPYETNLEVNPRNIFRGFVIMCYTVSLNQLTLLIFLNIVCY